MRTAGLLLVLVLLGLSARAEGFRSPGGVLQLAQHAAREAALLASGGTSAEAWDTEELGSIQAREAEWSHTAASSQVAEAVLPELSASPWFCHGIDCPGFQVDDNFHLEEMETVERRTYDASKWVSVRVKGVSYDKAMYDGFMTLFRFISGTNEKQAKIPMTAPVKTRIVPGPGPTCENDFIISFFIPFEFQAETPSPTEEGVYLEDVEPFTVYVASFGGRAKEEAIVQQASDLASALSAQGVQIVEDYYFSAGYDPPFRLFNRHNEVWLVEAAKQRPSFGDPDADYDVDEVDVHYVEAEADADGGLDGGWKAVFYPLEDYEAESDDPEYVEEDEYDEDLVRSFFDWYDEDYAADDEEEEEEEDDDTMFFGDSLWRLMKDFKESEDEYSFEENEDYAEDAEEEEEEEWDEWEVEMQRMMRPCGHMQQRAFGGAGDPVDLEDEDAEFVTVIENIGTQREPILVIEFGSMVEEDSSRPAGVMDAVLDDLLHLFRLY